MEFISTLIGSILTIAGLITPLSIVLLAIKLFKKDFPLSWWLIIVLMIIGLVPAFVTSLGQAL